MFFAFGSESYIRFDSHRFFNTNPNAIKMFPIIIMYIELHPKTNNTYMKRAMFPTINPVFLSVRSTNSVAGIWNKTLKNG